MDTLSVTADALRAHFTAQIFPALMNKFDYCALSPEQIDALIVESFALADKMLEEHKRRVEANSRVCISTLPEGTHAGL